MAKEKILVVDDEEDILELVRYNLSKEGYTVDCVKSGEKAIAFAKSKSPDLIVLDLMLPGVDGLEVCKLLKADSTTSQIPIIMLTAKSEDADIVSGLELGADDFITKPFSPRVLIARIRVVLRRASRHKIPTASIIKIHDFIIDSTRHEVIIAEQKVRLTPSEFKILAFLAARPGWVFTRDQIIETVKGDDYIVTERSIDVQIVGLRKKLGEHGKFVDTVRGVGYRFRE